MHQRTADIMAYVGNETKNFIYFSIKPSEQDVLLPTIWILNFIEKLCWTESHMWAMLAKKLFWLKKIQTGISKKETHSMQYEKFIFTTKIEMILFCYIKCGKMIR